MYWMHSISCCSIRLPQPPLYHYYFSKLKKYDDDMESVEKDMQIWRKSMVTDDETQALEEQIDRITKVKEHEPEMDLEDP